MIVCHAASACQAKLSTSIDSGPIHWAHFGKTKGGLEPAEPYASYAPAYWPMSLQTSQVLQWNNCLISRRSTWILANLRSSSLLPLQTLSNSWMKRYVCGWRGGQRLSAYLKLRTLLYTHMQGEKQLYAGNYEIHIGDLKHAVVLAWDYIANPIQLKVKP